MVPAQDLLALLPSFASLGKGAERYEIGLWHYLHYPLSAFGMHWGSLLVKGKAELAQSDEVLRTLRNVVKFLGQVSSRNFLAARLEKLADEMLQQVQDFLQSPGMSLDVHRVWLSTNMGP